MVHASKHCLLVTARGHRPGPHLSLCPLTSLSPSVLLAQAVSVQGVQAFSTVLCVN